MDKGVFFPPLRLFGKRPDWLKGTIFRVGHMGWVHPHDIDRMLGAVERALETARLPEAV